MRIKGTPVILYEKSPAGKDDTNRQTYEETPVYVENILIGTPTAEEITETLNLTGKRAEYILAIPKGDMNDWEDRRVEILDPWPVPGVYHTVGPMTCGIEELVPGPWNKQIKVERYGGSGD